MSAPTHLAARVQALVPSKTLAVAARARALANQGKDIVDFSVGEPDGAPPPWAVDAARRSLDDGEHGYPPVPGIPSMRAAVGTWFQRRHGVAVAPEEVLITLGGKGALHLLAVACEDSGDEVILPSPAWVSYDPQLTLVGARTVAVPGEPEDGFLPDPDRIRAAITPRTRAIILTSPSNPTGTVIPEERLRALGCIAIEHGLLVIADEMYDALRYDGQNGPTALDYAPGHAVVVDAVSKTFAMTGWRVGWMAGPKALIEACTKIHGHQASGLPTFTQRAAAAALTGSLEFLPGVVSGYQARRDLLHQGLSGLDGIEPGPLPMGAFYLFPRVDGLYGRRTRGGRDLRSSLDVANWWLEEAGVAVVPGEAFGEDRCVRLSYATAPARVVEGARRLRALLA